MVVNDSLLGQVFPGELCNIYIGSKNEASLRIYSGYITNYQRTGFKNQFTTDRTMGTYGISRDGITDGEVSFDVVLLGSDISEITYMVGSTNSAGYRQYILSNDDKLFKIKLEFIETPSGSVGSPIQQVDKAYKEVYYNCHNTMLNPKLIADDYLKGKLSFVLSPFNELGSSNYRELDKGVGIATGSWGFIEDEWNVDLGSTWGN